MNYPGLEFKNLQNNEVHLWAADLDLLTVPEKEAKQGLSESEIERSERFRFESIRTRYIKGHYLLRMFLGRYLGIDFYNQEFVLNRHGKPYIKNTESEQPIYFNFSKSENIYVYAFTQDGEIGVDVEKVQDLSDMNSMAARTFSLREHESFRSLSELSKKNIFFKHWTRKEALLKAMGLGLSFPLKKVDVLFNEETNSEVLVKVEQINAEKEWTLRDLEIFEGFSSALALEGKHIDCSVRLRYFQ